VPKHNAIQYPVDQVRAWIEEGKTHNEIAALLRKSLDPRVSTKLVQKMCKKNGIKCQRTGPRSGQGHPEWNGGRIQTRLGYWKVYCPDHPSLVPKNEARKAKANGGYYRKNVYVWEHRLVMESKLGRLLESHEVVHHIDEDPSNNAPENLKLFRSNGQHLEETLAGKVPKWTDGGRERIRLAQTPEAIRARVHLKASIRRASGEDVPLNNPELRRYLKRLGKSLLEASEMASRQELPPF